jgi:hypothetical protein
VRPLTLEELDRRWSDLEAAADATPGIDPWCSGPDWQLPVAAGFAPAAPRLLLTTDDGAGFALLSEYRDERGRALLSGLEPLWGFGCPVLGPDPAAVAAQLADHLIDRGERRPLLLPGLPPLPRLPEPGPGPRRTARSRVGSSPAEPGPDPAEWPLPPGRSDPTGARRTTLPVAEALSDVGRVGIGPGITRLVADLTGGLDPWMARRSAKFRRNLRRAVQTAERAGLRVVDTSDDPAVFARILAIEQRSWKGREGSGLTSPDMTATYRAMVERLQARGRLLASVAIVDGRDVGYILGGLRGRRYRGLQLSYTAEADRLSIGNLLQFHQLKDLTARDGADVYDLGMDFGYKRRWADRSDPSAILLVEP